MHAAKANNWTPLFIAIYHGELGKVKSILTQDKNVIKHCDNLGNNAYLLAALYGRNEIFKWITSEEANKLNIDQTELTLHVQNSACQTPFLAAAFGDQIDFIQYLLIRYPQEKNQLLAQVDKFKQNAFAIAKFYGHQDICNYLQPLEKDEKSAPMKKMAASDMKEGWASLYTTPEKTEKTPYPVPAAIQNAKEKITAEPQAAAMTKQTASTDIKSASVKVTL